ncbi:zf-HC2 domain-containing protein [Kitasatospora sp. NBC_00458]|uniref:zf-HC2 domain-containing protein n=1 Tax=Kitasatospora sp. NBC_00458 TaxID=2903568 RepID=UPI002E195B13
MRCAQLRTALSARLDGEPAGVPDRRLDKHVARCAACREWLERAERLRGTPAADGADGPPEDWSVKLLGRLAAERDEEGSGRPGQGDDGRTR